MEGSQADLDLKALEAFLVGNRDLERLEALLDRFNILEALGVVRQELRHSDFLRFLLDPRNPHGLGDAFVKRLLQRVLMSAGDVPVPVTPIELELWDLGRVEVRREWNNIDILLLDEGHKLAVVVENKIGAREHSDQLRRYYRIVEEHFSGWRTMAVYLTPSGDAPSHEAYLPVDYGLVCEVMDGLAEDRASVVSPDLKALMTHYTDMLRRNIVGDSDVARLCREIYRKHKRALDLIYAHRPDLRLVTRGLLVGLIESAQGLVYRGKVGNNLFFFRPPEWDEVPAFNAGEAVYGFFRFVFHKRPDGLDLYLETSPGDDEVRVTLYEMGQKDGDLFNHLEDPETPRWDRAAAVRGGGGPLRAGGALPRLRPAGLAVRGRVDKLIEGLAWSYLLRSMWLAGQTQERIEDFAEKNRELRTLPSAEIEEKGYERARAGMARRVSKKIGPMREQVDAALDVELRGPQPSR